MSYPPFNRRLFVSALATSALSFPAWAHGPGGHARQGGQGQDAHHGQPVIKEQKPWGIAGEPREVTRTVEIRMTDDMRFAPAHISVKLGETLRLVAINAGQILHEIVIGTPEELAEHAALMQKFPDMDHDEPYMAHVDPGQRGEIIWTFNRAGSFEFACLIPGHFEAGMKGTLTVTP